MAARVDELCDAAKARIEAAAAANPIAGTTVTVSVDDDPDVDPDELAAGEMLVFVWWASYRDAGPADRDEDATAYTLVFLAVEKCGADDLESGRVPTAWRRVRSEWLDAVLVRSFGDPRERLADTAYADALEDVEFDRDELVERKLFWCTVTVTFIDHAEA